MTGNLSTTQSVKQSTRQFMSVASDKMKLASSVVARGDTRELDVAIIKSTTPQFHVVPKEKHVRTLKEIVLNGTKDHVREVIKELLQRLKTATDWLTALKCLMVLHRLMRECSSTFLNALAQQSTSNSANLKGKGLLNMGNFLDTTNIDGRFDYSEWVRGYGKYLDEQLEVFKELNYYPEMESGGESSRMRTLAGDQLLKQLPTLQRLQQRLTDCKPRGAAAHDPVVQAALMAILKESFKVYKAVSEGIINLADRFFEMEYLDAARGLEIYKESLVDNARLQEYYREVEQIEELKRAVQFPRLESLPPDFLAQMEGYVKDAPRPIEEAVTASKKKSPPLRRGTKATGPKAASRFETATSGTPSDPGMIGVFPKANEPDSAKVAAEEPNLLDLEELTISEPSPATTGPSSTVPNGFGGSEISPAGDSNDPFATPLQGAFSPNTIPENGMLPPVNPGNSMQSFQQPMHFPHAASQPSGMGSNPFGATSFGPQTQLGNSVGPGASAGSPGSFRPMSSAPSPGAIEQFPSGLPQSRGPATAPQPRGGMPMTPQSMGSYGSQSSPYGSQQTSFSGPQMQQQQQGFGSYQPGNAFSVDVGTHGGSFGGLSQGPPTSLAGSQAGFGGAQRPPSQPQMSPGRAPGPATAAGIVKPTNVVLAKEAALHDPFASLASLRPSGPAKQSPPLKVMGAPSPASTAGPASSASSMAAQPGFGQQPQLNQFSLNGNQDFGTEAFPSNKLGTQHKVDFQSTSIPPSQQQQQPMHGSQKLGPSTYVAEAGNGSLI